MMYVVEKHFIHNQRQIVPVAQFVQFSLFGRANVGSGGIVGMYHNHRACALMHRAIERGEIDLPSVIVDERIGHQFHVLQVSQELKQGITRPRHKNLVARIREQAQHIRITLAGAGGEHDRCRVDFHCRRLAAVVVCDGGTCREQSFGLRIVVQHGGTG